MQSKRKQIDKNNIVQCTTSYVLYTYRFTRKFRH